MKQFKVGQRVKLKSENQELEGTVVKVSENGVKIQYPVVNMCGVDEIMIYPPDKLEVIEDA